MKKVKKAKTKKPLEGKRLYAAQNTARAGVMAAIAVLNKKLMAANATGLKAGLQFRRDSIDTALVSEVSFSTSDKVKGEKGDVKIVFDSPMARLWGIDPAALLYPTGKR